MVKKKVVEVEEVCEYQLEQERLREIREERKAKSIERRDQKKSGRHAWANRETEE